MFDECSSLTSLDVSGFDTSNVTDMYGMFYKCSNLTSLNVSGWDTSKVTGMGYMYYNCSSLKKVTLGSNNIFRGSGSTNITLPTPPASQSGVTYTGKWIREDGAFGPFTPAELRDNYTSDMAGTWIWEVPQ
jgi:surface protein